MVRSLVLFWLFINILIGTTEACNKTSAAADTAAQGMLTTSISSLRFDTGTNSNFLDMEIDGEAGESSAPSNPSKRGRVEKRRYKSSRKASIIFPKFKDGKKVKPSRGKK